MPNGFNPAASKDVLVRIKPEEAVMIEKMRKFAYSKFTVVWQNQLPVRIESYESIIIDPDTPLSIIDK